MLPKQAILLAALAAVSVAAPAAKVDVNSLFKRAKVTIPDKVKAPKEGECGLLVYSATILPVGGEPTTVEGEGIAPSQVGDQEAAVINHNKVIIGPAKNLAAMSPGFAADIPLDNDMGTVHMTADYIAPGKESWGIEWRYKGKEYQGVGDPDCEQYNFGFISAYSIHSCYFPC